MTQPMRISPNCTVDDWEALAFTVEEDWQKAVNILEDRLRGRFFDIVAEIKDHPFAGFAVLALDCLLIETLQQFRKGMAKTPPRKGCSYFVSFLTETSFGSYFNKITAGMFYDQIRCGILHQAEVKESSRVRKDSPTLVEFTADGRGLIVNRDLFHSELVKAFKQYLADLRDPQNGELRRNFRKKMDHICRVTEVEHPMTMPKTTNYFAYGSNMKTERLICRVPSARLVGRARLPEKRLVCNKRSQGRSAKANLETSPGDVVWGVLFQIDLSELGKLDGVEVGYQREEVRILDEDGNPLKAHTYISNKLTDDPVLHDRYKQLIIDGAREHHLPEEYIATLEELPSKPDRSEQT